MGEKKGVSLFSIILILIILGLAIGFIYMFSENQKLNSQLSERNKTIENLGKEIAGLKNTNSENQSSNSTNSYKIGTIKNIHDVISDNDTKTVKAQKIAKEVMTAVNNKDWYYLAKMVGTDADNFIKYGIHNYNINVKDCQEINGNYVFNETYQTNSTVTESLGKRLIIKFENGGKIVVDPNCTGV